MSSTATVEALKQVPLLGCLSQRELKRVAGRVRETTFLPGMTVLTEGKMGGVGFFIVVEGEASVSVDGKEVARLQPGDHFGELGLISKSVRTATVTALTSLTCLVMASWDFQNLVKQSPNTAWKLLQHVVNLLDLERARSR
jgi:CRP/FNR family cyclic AMP-dependent transcriptional regulator